MPSAVTIIWILFSRFQFLGHSYSSLRTMRDRLQPGAYINLTLFRACKPLQFGGPTMSARHRRLAGHRTGASGTEAVAIGIRATRGTGRVCRQPFHGPAGVSIAPARVTAAALIIPLPCG